MNKRSAISVLWTFIRNRWRTIIVGFVFVTITNLLNVLVPSYIGRGIDLLRSDFTRNQLFHLCGSMLAIGVFMGISRFLMRYIIIGASWRLEGDSRKVLFDHILKLPVSYYSRARTGDIIARFTNDLTAVRAMIGPAIMYSMNALILMPLALAYMISLDAELALYAVLPFPFLAVMMNRVGHAIHRRFRRVQESYSDISAHVQEDLTGIRLVKSYARESHELNTLRNLSLDYLEQNRGVIHLQSLAFSFLDVLASMGIILVLWIGGGKVISGKTSLGTIVSMIMYVNMLVWPSIALGWVVAVLQRGLASAGRIMDVLDEQEERQDDTTEITPLDGAISVKGLTFSYDGETPDIADISFDLKPGGMLALVGRTGSGKSTILSLLTGAHPIDRGVIFYDGVDINDISLDRLRSSLSLVPQETFLFSETVSENIAFGNENADDEMIHRAAEYAAIHETIDSFPDRYETRLGERGISVSGGQRQRLTIARAIVSEAPILFFDDCLSSVDTEKEMTILENLKKVTSNRTSIIVTQRLGAITGADEILYLRDGRIVERGTHKELMDLDGEYAALYSEQESLEIMEDSDWS